MNGSGHSRRRFVGLIGAGLVASGTGVSSAARGTTERSRVRSDADWPMAGSDAGHTGYNAGASPPTDGVAVDWQNHFVNAATRPIVVDGWLSVWDANRNLYDVDLESGAIEGTVTFPYGTPFSPTVVDDRYYVGVGHSVLGNVVFAATPEDTDDRLWEYEPDGTLRSSPAVVDDVVCFRTGDGLVALERDTGDVRWTAEIGGGSNTPAVADGTIYAADSSQYGDSAGTVYAIDATSGDERWTWSAADIVSDRVVVADGTVYVRLEGERYNQQTVVALAADTGTERWRTSVDGSVEQPLAVDDDTVYVATAEGWSTLFALDAATGDERWTYPVDRGTVAGQPAVADGTVHVATDEGTVHAVDTAAGSARWTASLPVGDSPTLALAGDRVIVAGTGIVVLKPGNETALEHLADGLPVDWRYDDGGNYGTESVSIVDDTAVLGSGESLAAFDPGDGETAWTATLEHEGEDSELDGPPVTHGGAIHAATEDGVVTGFEADGDDALYRTELETDIDAPVAAGDGGVAVATADDEVAVLDEGTVRWQGPVADGVAGAPAVDGDTVVVAAETADSDTRLYGLAADSGDERWVSEFSPTDESDPVAERGIAIVGDTDVVRGLAATDGTEHWTVPIQDPMRAATVADGVVYVVTGESSRLRASTGAVHAIDAATGDLRWSRRIGNATARPAVIGGTVYAATRSGTTYAFAAHDGELLAWRAFDSPVSSLASHGERLLVAFDGSSEPAAIDVAETTTPPLDQSWPAWADAGTASSEAASEGSTADGDGSDDSTPGFGILGTAAGVAGAGLYRTLVSDPEGDD